MIDINKLTENVKKQTIDDAMLVASAVIAALGHSSDDISQVEAYRLYGKKWIDDRTNRGLLTRNREGEKRNSQITYSKFEIQALKRAEKKIQKAFDDATRTQERLAKQLM